MSIIDIRTFGGEMPSASARALPANYAQKAINLMAGTAEFRPLRGPQTLTTTDSVLNPGSVVPNPKTLYRTAYKANGTVNSDLAAGWLVNGGVINAVRGQIHGSTEERTYYTGSGTPRKFGWQSGVLVDRPMGVPAPAAAPVVAHVVVDEFRTSEMEAGSAASVTHIENTLWSQTTAAMVGCDIAFTAPTTTSFGWLPHATDPTRKLLRVPMTNGAIAPGYEFVLDPTLKGVLVTAGTDFWQIEVPLFATAWSLNPVTLKAALLAIEDPVRTGVDLLTDADATFATNTAVTYFSTSAEPQAALINTALTRTRAIQNLLTTAKTGAVTSAFYASETYKKPLLNLIGDGTVVGTVTAAIHGYVYVMVGNTMWGATGNNPAVFIGGTSRYWYTAFAGYTDAIGKSLIRADLLAFIGTDAKGAKFFNYEGMAAILRTEFNGIVNQRTTESQNHYRPLIEGWITEVLAPIKAFFEPQSMAVLSYGLSGGSTAAAFTGLVSGAESALNSVTSLYTAMRQSVGILARKLYASNEVSARGLQADAAVTPIIDSRFYIATYVTDWGEESAPSPVSELLEVDQNDVVSVTIALPVGRPDITKWRLYRTNVGSTSASFQGLHEGFLYTGPSPLTFMDTYKSSELQEVCPTITWLEPDPKLGGLVGLPNGSMAGFVDNTVSFSEPYVPHAWPAEYDVTVESAIVGLGVFGQTIFVGTTGSPYFISGADAASMSVLKLESTQSCVSARSIVAVEGGVIFASPDGLCLADQSGVKVLSSGLWSSEDWEALQPSTIFAASYEGAYVFVCNSGTKCYMLGNGKLVQLDLTCSALFTDKATGALCAAVGSSIVDVMGTARRIGVWRTPLITLPSQQSLAWAKVYGDQSAGSPVTVTWYGDGALRHTLTFTNLQPQRLPAGRWLEHEVEISSTARVTRVTLASTTDELKGT